MYCPQCGQMNDDNNYKCVTCGNVLPQTPGSYPPPLPPPLSLPTNVPNYLVPAILTTVFCCLPFGIVSIVYANQVNTFLAAGNLAAARDSSNKARTWCWVSFGVSAACVALYIVLSILGEAAKNAR